MSASSRAEPQAALTQRSALTVVPGPQAPAGVGNGQSTPLTEAVILNPRLRILLVDDEPALLTVTKRVLVRRGFEVEIAHCGQEALDNLAALAPDVVVSDFHMPGMNGIELLVAMAKRSPHTRRILLSGVLQIGQNIDATVLSKPWFVEDLVCLCSQGRLP